MSLQRKFFAPMPNNNGYKPLSPPASRHFCKYAVIPVARNVLIGKRGAIPSLRRAKRPALEIVADAGSRDVSVQCLGQRVVTGDDVMLAPFRACVALSPRRGDGGPRLSF